MSSTLGGTILIYGYEKVSQSLYESVLNCNFDVYFSKLNSEQDVIMPNNFSPMDVHGCILRSYFSLHSFDTNSSDCSLLNGSEIDYINEWFW